MAELPQQVDGQMLPEKMEAYDVHEVQEDGCAVGDDKDHVDDALRHLVDDFLRGKAIIEDERQVEYHQYGQVEAHPFEIQPERLAEAELVEKLQVEQIHQPPADAERQQDGQQPVNKQHRRRGEPFFSYSFSGLIAHALFCLPWQK